VVAELPIEDHALWQAAFDRVAANYGGELDAATVLLVLAKDYLEKPINERETETRRAFQVVYHRCTTCERAWIQTEDGPEGIPTSKVAAREPLARVVRLPIDKADVGASLEANAVDRADLQKAVGDGVAAERKASDRNDRAQPLARRNGSQQTIGTGDQNRPTVTVEESPSLERCESHPVDPRGSLLSADPTHVDRNRQKKLLFDFGPAEASMSGRARKKVPQEFRDKPNTPAIRQKVLGRDGMTCRAPGCPNRAELICHHVVFRSEGGATEIANEVALCQFCHGSVHEGLLQVNGGTPGELEWFDSDGEALSRFEGGSSGVRLAIDLAATSKQEVM